MSDVVAAPPVLITLMEELSGGLTRLQEVTAHHRQLKQTLQQVTGGITPDQAGVRLEMHIGNLRVPLALPGDRPSQEAYLQEALAGLGDEAVRLWRRLHDVTKKANDHLDAVASQQG